MTYLLDHQAILNARLARLTVLRRDPAKWPYLRRYYRDHPAQLIDDWGCTYDPRNVEVGLPAVVPFRLFPRQVEWVEWFYERWRSREDGITEKSRDMGISWLAVATSIALCVTYDDLTIGFGSKTEDDVDKAGDPQSLFWKARQFISYLPEELRAGFDGSQAVSSHMRLTFPVTGSTIKGDAGDDIGRGDRTSAFFVDESAKLARPALVDAALAQTTNCRMDLSTPRGRANRFAERRFSGRVKVFTFHWRDDPRKDEAWYEKQKERLDPITLAQEVDMDYSASAEGVLIPTDWLSAAVDADAKLGIAPSGMRAAGFDVADEGADTLALAVAHGASLLDVVEWSGRGGDLHASTSRALELCESYGATTLIYDADGLGAGVRGSARVLNEARVMSGRQAIDVAAFRGSESPARPEAEDVKGTKNGDLFLNAKAQAWWALRLRFYRTWQAVEHGVMPDDLGELISIPGTMRLRSRLLVELNQPTYSLTAAGKIQIDKAPSGTKSPNLADAVMIRFASVLRPMRISRDAIVRNALPSPLLARAAPRPGVGISAAALARFR